MMIGTIAFGIFGLTVLVSIALAFSSRRQKIDWKLVASGAYRQLFDLASDPNEENDLASKRPDKLTELSALLQAEQEKEKGAKLTQPKP